MTLLLLLACRPDPPPVGPGRDTGTRATGDSAVTIAPGPGDWTDPLQRGSDLGLDVAAAELTDVLWAGDLLLAVGQEQTGDGGLWAFDVSDPDAPWLLGRTHVRHYQRVCWDGDAAWTTTRDGLVSRIGVGEGGLEDAQEHLRGSWAEGIACSPDQVAWGLGADGGEVATLGPDGALDDVRALPGEVRDALWHDGSLWTVSYGALTRWDLGGSEPAPVATLALTGTCLDLAGDGDRLAVACGSAGVHLVDPAGPTLVGGWSGHVSARAVDLVADRLAVAGWTEALVLDVSDPAAPRLRGSEGATEAAMAVALGPERLAVADWHQAWLADVVDVDAPEVRALESWAQPGGRVNLFNDGSAPLWLDTPSAGTVGVAVLEPGQNTPWSVPDDATGTLTIGSDDPDEAVLSVRVGGVVGLTVGDPAPEFLEPDLAGTPWSLEALRGEVVFLGLFTQG